MPIFEYRCNSCGREFETLVRASSQPACPQCGGQSLDKLLSVPAVPAAVSEPAMPSACGSCGGGGGGGCPFR